MLPEQEHDVKSLQQHLANERTFLAWVRTSIAMIGFGFLTAGLAFQSDSFANMGNILARVGGIGAVLLGACVLIWATRDFFLKQKGIRDERLVYSTHLIWFLFISLGLITLLLIFLVVLMLL
ncbi:YidH family protein [Paenibacillus physcomitrellae]|uniref:DUF202 domain-containing protein n=1 Tax=Paenibacillus physcomitrellae TaxID=1619311 RepID=A0ABQ1FLR4_9BACL|nr:DUF202 domain-containing protein [Paenibacillus physcomitrellae]GGA21177.1 hypothetical protein GCM10010917_02360 [Paenibacillus physcomitrellae]